jgi:DNA-directed RNA polymerase subunit RPC12/RpoP
MIYCFVSKAVICILKKKNMGILKQRLFEVLSFMEKADKLQKFDMDKKPERQKNYLRPLTWILSFPSVWKHGLKIKKVNMKGLKPPYILLCNHTSFMDFKVMTAAIFPYKANYVVAIDGFIGRETLLRKVGCICKRKFTNDIGLVRHINHVVNINRDIIILHPEARYSLVGTNAILPESLGKLVKFLKVPVVTLNMHGNYLNSPCWNLTERGNRIEAELTQIISEKQVSELTHNQINACINNALKYDEYTWQKENKISIKYKNNAKGLHKVLYQCPSCMTEFMMDSDKNRIWCNNCGKEWIMSEFGELQAVIGITEFSHIPDWYEFERKQVRKQIEEKTYEFSDDVLVDSLPNAKGYIRLGPAKLSHNLNGFYLEGCFGGKKFSLSKEPLSMYSCHIEYEYFNKGDCIDLSTLDDTYYIYPQSKLCAVTKISLATEELFKFFSADHIKNNKILPERHVI